MGHPSVDLGPGTRVAQRRLCFLGPPNPPLLRIPSIIWCSWPYAQCPCLQYGRRCLVNEVAKERWYPRSVKMLIVNDNGDMTAWMEASLSNDLNDQGKALRGQLQKYVVDPALDAAVKLAWKAVSSAVTVV